MAKVSRIQWHDKQLDRFHKYDGVTKELLSTKMTEGPYADIEIVKSQPITAEKEAEMVGKRKKKINYLSNKELLKEYKLSAEQGQMTDRFAHMLILLTQRISKKSNFANYTYIEDMRSYAITMLVATWSRFKPEKSDNPFSYYTTCIQHSFIQFLNQEKRQRNIRDEIMVKNGKLPSFTYQEEYAQAQEDERNSDDSSVSEGESEDSDQ